MAHGRPGDCSVASKCMQTESGSGVTVPLHLCLSLLQVEQGTERSSGRRRDAVLSNAAHTARVHTPEPHTHTRRAHESLANSHGTLWISFACYQFEAKLPEQRRQRSPRRAPGYAARLPAEDDDLARAQCKTTLHYHSLNISLISEPYKFDF